MTPSSKKIAVIGAGPAGLTAAHQLAKSGASVHVFEGGERIGGMAGSFEVWGHRVDYGSHRFFSKDPRVNALFHDVLGPEAHLISRLSRIYYRGKLFDYPLKASNALQNLGLWEGVLCATSYAAERLRLSPGSDKTFEDWVTRRFGRRLFDHFFKSYSEKVWGLPCNQLGSDFAAQRIRSFNLGVALKQALFPGRSSHRTLADQFYYPERGSGRLYEKMADKLKAEGAMISLKTAVSSLRPQSDGTWQVESGATQFGPFDHVISSMPLTHLIGALPVVPESVRASSRELTFRNTILVYLKIPGRNLFRDNWLYIHSPELRCGRITNYCNWHPSLCGEIKDTVLSLEFWANDDDPLWNADDAKLIGLAAAELRQTGLLKGAEISDGLVRRVPRCYPIYKLGYLDHVGRIASYLNTLVGLSVIGRYGSFKYNNQDHSILMGILAAENALSGARHDLWSVNSDREYQET